MSPKKVFIAVGLAGVIALMWIGYVQVRPQLRQYEVAPLVAELESGAIASGYSGPTPKTSYTSYFRDRAGRRFGMDRYKGKNAEDCELYWCEGKVFAARRFGVDGSGVCFDRWYFCDNPLMIDYIDASTIKRAAGPTGSGSAESPP